jgi:hypothetical protein
MAEVKAKTPRDLNGIELRMRVRQGPVGEAGVAAMAELERRRDNLARAVIPAWEREARGADPADWDLVD